MAVFCVDTGSVGMYRCRLGADSQGCRKPSIFWSVVLEVARDFLDAVTDLVGGFFGGFAHRVLLFDLVLQSPQQGATGWLFMRAYISRPSIICA